jgi:hypothetical protein
MACYDTAWISHFVSFVRAAVFFVLSLSAGVVHAEEFLQARCDQHRTAWRGPRRSESHSDRALRDADLHNRRHRGHDARVMVVARED